MQVHPFYWLALSFLGYYCAYGVFLPFFPAWLKSQQYGEEMIGIVIGSAYIFRFIGGLFFSSLIQKADHIINSLRLLALCSTLIMAIMSLVTDNFWLLFFAIGLFAMVNSAGMPIGDSLASTWQRQIGLDYGKVRLIGSAAFVLGVVVFGGIIDWVGEQNIVWILTALLLFYTLIQLLKPSIPPKDETLIDNTPTQIGFLTLLKDSTTLRVMIGVGLIQSSHAAYYVYSTIYWTSIGISVSQTSLLWGVGVLAEILLFFFSRCLFQNWAVSLIFFLSAIVSILRWAGLAYADTFWQILLLQLAHGLTYAACHYAIVRYITTQPQNHIAKLQGLYNGLSNGALIALFSAISGLIYPISPTMTFLLMSVIAALSLLVIPRKLEAFLVKQN
ncbi:3-phenylpropionate MFS transporter [Rodentibacter sp. Ppn85]|uniref:3-phenylpropionate MFS transporter n=1 Tax=Rodentibacter sp. Ppn85 TaxID=1908525 RepID=UPI000984C147|nr:3-phenylpropionate MFS transporter [Rodentibacter sp. Ppn85]OOF61927.1 3-phenylpropionic acid transporter [Rodentibacter sp. Ppn85]